MGLSLLLKLFEEWEGKDIKVEVQNPNRMVNMLFKITGLGRFVKGDSGQSGGVKAINPQAPIHADAKKAVGGEKAGEDTGKSLFHSWKRDR